MTKLLITASFQTCHMTSDCINFCCSDLALWLNKKIYRNDIRPTPPQSLRLPLVLLQNWFDPNFRINISRNQTQTAPLLCFVDFTCYIPVFRECTRSTCKNIKRQHIYKIFWRCVGTDVRDSVYWLHWPWAQHALLNNNIQHHFNN